jgi:hypothetical protein
VLLRGQVYRRHCFVPYSIAPVCERDHSRALLVLYPPNPNYPATIGIYFVNPLHAERFALDGALLWFTANYFSAGLNQLDGLEQVESDCGNGCHVPPHLSASMVE